MGGRKRAGKVRDAEGLPEKTKESEQAFQGRASCSPLLLPFFVLPLPSPAPAEETAAGSSAPRRAGQRRAAPRETPTEMQRTAVYSAGRKLSDDCMYVVSVFDLDPAGMLVRAYCQRTSSDFTLAVTEAELRRARITRSDDDVRRLADSVDVFELEGATRLRSNVEEIRPPRHIPRGDAVRDFINETRVGDDRLPALLTRGLSELCKVKPAGLDAVKWLGEWLLKNNPNQPAVDEPEDA